MTAATTSHPRDIGAVPRKGLNIALWGVQLLLALAFVGASWPKLLGRPDMVALFEAVSIGQWFRYVTGILELTAAVLIVVPKTRSVGAALLLPIMIGAIITNLFIVHIAPTPPLVLFLLASFVVWGRRRELTNLFARSRGPGD
jgi:uncharacterized membrane protein YphA (DoxX/SURF4 family)